MPCRLVQRNDARVTEGARANAERDAKAGGPSYGACALTATPTKGDPRPPAVCAVCSRDPARMNNDMAECSHIECPHRRHCWSDGTAEHQPPAAKKPGRNPIERLFDKSEV